MVIFGPSVWPSGQGKLPGMVFDIPPAGFLYSAVRFRPYGPTSFEIDHKNEFMTNCLSGNGVSQAISEKTGTIF